MKQTIIHNKRGFTLLELAVVMIVIAILAAILIPSFSNVGSDTDRRVDETTVDNINMALDSAETLNKKPKSITNAIKILTEGGYAAEALIPNTANFCYVWDKNINRALMIDLETDLVSYPQDYAAVNNTGSWYELSTSVEYPCPEAIARQQFVNAVLYYRGELQNASAYAGVEASKRYALLVAEIRAEIMGHEKSALCYAVYDRQYQKLITTVSDGYRIMKSTYSGTIPDLSDPEHPTTTPVEVCRIKVVADNFGTEIDFFNNYLNNPEDTNEYYFYTDGRLGGDMDTLAFSDTGEHVFGTHVYMFPQYTGDFTPDGTEPVVSWFTIPEE